MDYRKECESRLLEVSIGAHKLTQMISSWSKEPNLNNNQRPSKDLLLKGSFDVEDSLSTLRKLQQATKVMSQVRQDLEVNLDREGGGFGSTHSRRFESNCIEELKMVIRESGYGRNLGSVSGTDVDEWAYSSSSRSLRFSPSSSSNSSSDHVAQPRRGKGGPNLIAKLMGLEEIPSDREHELDKCSVRLEPPLGIQMLKARLLPLMGKKPEVRRNTLKDVLETVMTSKGPLENNGVDETSSFSSPSNRSSHTYGEVPPIVILKTPQLPERKKIQSTAKGIREKVCDNAQILSEKLEKKQVKKRPEKPEAAKPLQNSKQLASARQQQQRRMPSDTRKRDHDVVVQKSIPSPATSQAKLSSSSSSSRVPAKLDKSRATARSSEEVVLLRGGANAPRSHQKSVTWGSMEPAKAKKKQETGPARKAIDIILAATGKARYNDAKTINQSRPLPVEAPQNHKENSKHCNRGHRRGDSKIFCEIMVKASKGGRNSRPSSEAKQLRPDGKTTIQIADNAIEDVKLLLLSSQSFINHAQELFRLGGSRTSTYHQMKGIVEVRAKNAKLLLGCARELVVHRSRKLEGSNHPFNQTGWLSRSSAVASVDQLVEEIANEVVKLRVYGNVDKGASSDQDVVYAMMEGDLRGKNVLLNAMWDQGWMEWVCLEEVDYVVGPLERLILCGLIEELVLDLLH